MMITAALTLASAVHAQEPPSAVTRQIQNARTGISEDDRRQRDALSRMFVIDQKIKEIAQKQEQLNQRVLAQEGVVRALAQDVQALEQRADQQKMLLNKRLRLLYERRGEDEFRWLFSAQSPVELERNRRYMRLMAENDHRQLKVFLAGLEQLKRKREELKGKVARLAGLQKVARAEEQELFEQFNEKSRYLTDIRKAREAKISELKGLRNQQGEPNDALAFFERKGALHPPVDVPVRREYGTYVDPQFRFRLTHKGLFYSTSKPNEVRAVYFGRVVFAGRLPGWGHTVIIDHGDNYYSVYAFASQLKVRDGAKVREGDLVALAGDSSPLFGPGLYFEIRHFTDAIDPRPWIKDSVIKTAAGSG
jgi:septal ring factor EnvC (AmiA/AmiB activator)